MKRKNNPDLSIYLCLSLCVYLSICMCVSIYLSVCLYVSICLSTYLPTFLWLYSPLLDLGRFFSFLIYTESVGLL
jgi:hypothetical protein